MDSWGGTLFTPQEEEAWNHWRKVGYIMKRGKYTASVTTACGTRRETVGWFDTLEELSIAKQRAKVEVGLGLSITVDRTRKRSG